MHGQWTRAGWMFGLLALAVAAQGCSGAPGGPIGSSTGPSSVPTDGGGGGARTNVVHVRDYDAGILAITAAAGSTATYTFTVTNCTAGSGDCTATSTKEIGSATVAVPNAFTPDWGTLAVTSTTGGTTWEVDERVGNLIKLRGVTPEGQNKLLPGGTVTFTISATAPCVAGDYFWNTLAYSGTDFTDNNFIIRGAQPKVTVTGTCATPPCTLGQGFWKAHGPIPQGNNSNEWPVTSLLLGTVNYTDLQLLSIFNTPVAGNGLINLAHQLIAAKLNVANGATAPGIATTIANADSMIGGRIVPPVGSGSLAPGDVGALVTALTAFNEAVCVQ